MLQRGPGEFSSRPFLCLFDSKQIVFFKESGSPGIELSNRAEAFYVQVLEENTDKNIQTFLEESRNETNGLRDTEQKTRFCAEKDCIAHY